MHITPRILVEVWYPCVNSQDSWQLWWLQWAVLDQFGTREPFLASLDVWLCPWNTANCRWVSSKPFVGMKEIEWTWVSFIDMAGRRKSGHQVVRIYNVCHQRICLRLSVGSFESVQRYHFHEGIMHPMNVQELSFVESCVKESSASDFNSPVRLPRVPLSIPMAIGPSCSATPQMLRPPSSAWSNSSKMPPAQWVWTRLLRHWRPRRPCSPSTQPSFAYQFCRVNVLRLQIKKPKISFEFARYSLWYQHVFWGINLLPWFRRILMNILTKNTIFWRIRCSSEPLILMIGFLKFHIHMITRDQKFNKLIFTAFIIIMFGSA